MALCISLYIHFLHQLNRQPNLNYHSKLVRINMIQWQISLVYYHSLEMLEQLQNLLSSFALVIAMRVDTAKRLLL